MFSLSHHQLLYHKDLCDLCDITRSILCGPREYLGPPLRLQLRSYSSSLSPTSERPPPEIEKRGRDHLFGWGRRPQCVPRQVVSWRGRSVQCPTANIDRSSHTGNRCAQNPHQRHMRLSPSETGKPLGPSGERSSCRRVRVNRPSA